MNDKDKIIMEDVASAAVDTTLSVADEIVSRIPLLGLAWGLSKALFGAGLKLRQKRALEWVEMVRDNPSIFTETILADEKFQDGFAYALEKYLIERNEKKRKIFRNIFLGFTKADNIEKFSLEKFTHTLSQLSELDIEVLKDINLEGNGQNYQIYGTNTTKIDNIYNLINLGILLDTTGSRLGHNPEDSPFVKVSIFGKEFISYIKDEDQT